MTEMILEEFPTECEVITNASPFNDKNNLKEFELSDLLLSIFQEIWLSSTESKREKSIGRGFLVKRYYHIRRDLSKSGVIQKKRSEEDTRNFIGELFYNMDSV